MATTMKDIAKICGLSAGAVSQVIRNPENPRFTVATRKLILDTAKALDYHQNPLSCALRTNRTNLIGLVLPWNEPEVMDSIESQVNENSYKMLLQFTAHPRGGMEAEALRSLASWNVDGILWEPSGSVDETLLGQLRQLQGEHRPMVLLERGIKGIEFPVVRTDYGPSLDACVRHLSEQGYEKIVLVTYDNDDGLENHQRESLEDACHASGLEFSMLKVTCDIGMQKQHLAKCLGVREADNVAYICVSWLSLSVMEVMESKGLYAPRDYGLVLLQDMLLGGNFRLSTFFRPTLTSIWVNSSRLAQRATALLMDHIRGKTQQNGEIYCEEAGFAVRLSTQRH